MNHSFNHKKTKNYTHSNHDGSLILQRSLAWDVDGAIYSGKSFLQSKIETLKLWKARVDSRRDLAFQNDRILEDIGLTRSDVEREANKWFWQN